MVVESVEGKAQVERTDEGNQVTIPTKKMYFHIVMLSLAFLMQMYAMVMIVTFESLPMDELLMIVGALGSTECILLIFILWMLFGKEVIIKNSEHLILKRQVFFLSRTKKYNLNQIGEYSVQKINKSFFSKKRDLEYFGLKGGIIKFTYGNKTIKFGSNLDESEAQYLIDNIFSK